MIKKHLLQSIIQKYYLGIPEVVSVKWAIEGKDLTINFMTPNKDVIGKVSYSNFDLEECDLIIYDTKKLLGLVNICDQDLMLETEGMGLLNTKLTISDSNYTLIYTLSDPLLVNKVGKAKTSTEWEAELKLDIDNVTHLIKAENAVPESNNLIVSTEKDLCKFTFGDESGHSNKIIYQIPGTITEEDLSIPFDSNMFKMVLSANKDMKEGKLLLAGGGLMKLEFESEDGVFSEYFVIRQTETSF